MLKYTDQGLIKTIKTEPITFIFVFGQGHFSAQNFTFECEILKDAASKITISEMEIEQWFVELFNDKIMTLPENNTEAMHAYFEAMGIRPEKIIFVQEYGSEYLIQLLYNIISKSLDGANKLLSIKILG